MCPFRTGRRLRAKYIHSKYCPPTFVSSVSVLYPATAPQDMDGGRAGGEDSENQEEMEATESESGGKQGTHHASGKRSLFSSEGEVAGLGMGSSLSQSVGVSQQPGPSGLHFSPHSLSSSLGGPNFTSPPPQPGPSRPPQVWSNTCITHITYLIYTSMESTCILM